MNPSIYSPPYGEPVSLAEIKNHCKVDSDMTDDDVLIMGLVTSARHATETASLPGTDRRAVMMATTFELTLDYFPWSGSIRLPRAPLISVESFTYIDSAGVSQTVSSSVYEIDYAAGRINLAYGESWPTTRYKVNAVTIRFIAGLAAVFTAVTATDVCTVQGRVLADGTRVQVMNSGGALPAGLSASTTYFVVNASGSTFKLSLTSGGAAIDLTIGTGTSYIGTDLASFQTLRNALMLRTAFLYFHREGVEVEPGLAAITLPMAVDALIASVYV